MKRTAAALKFALFVIAATALVFLLIEGGARVYVYVRDSGAAPGEPSVGPVTVELQPYKEYNVLFHTPNQDLVDTRIPSRKFHITINSFGFRGREITEKKPPGVVRIMVLGDSYTFGDGVDDEDTLPWALEDMLNERDAGVRYEVINAGVMGSYIKNESELYFNYARRFDPDVLILAYCWNDISEVAYFKFYKRLEEVAGQGAGHEDGRLARVARDTKIHSIAQQKKARDMAKRENEFVANKSGALNLGMLVEKIEPGASEDIEKAVERYKTELISFQNVIGMHRVRFMFIIFPTWLRDDEIKRPIHSELYEFAVDNGIPVLDLRESWLAGGGDIHSLFDVDDHPNADAFRITAAEIIKKLETEKMIE